MAAMLAVDAQPAPGPSRFRPIHLWLIVRPMALDLVATLVFGGLYALTGNLLLSTALGVAAGVGQVAWRLATGRPVAPLQWVGVGLVIATGAIALVTHSPLVIMLKPTLIYWVIGAGMLQPGWMIRYAIPMERSPIPPSAFTAAGFFIAALMLIGGGLNLYLALAASTKTWAAVMAAYALGSKVIGTSLVFVGFGVVARRNKRRGLWFAETSTPAAAQV